MANRVEVAVKIPGAMPDITKTPEYRKRLAETRAVAARSQKLAAEADTILERMQEVCKKISAQVATSHN